MVDMMEPTLITPRACAISTGSVVMSMMSMPAAKPWTTRDATRTGNVGEAMQHTEPARKAQSPSSHAKRPSRARSSQPATGIPMASASR